MNKKIKHVGVVDEVDGDRIKVRIVQSSACSSCKAAGYCNSSESKEKIVDVYDKNALNLSTGDKVIVVASQRNGYFAVVLTSVIPLIILVVVLTACIFITDNEATSALISLCALIPYYFVIYLLREKIRDKLSFYIEPLGEKTCMEESPSAQILIN